MSLGELLAELLDHIPMSPADRERLAREVATIGWRLDPRPRPSETRPLWGSDGVTSYFGDGTPVPEHLPPQED